MKKMSLILALLVGLMTTNFADETVNGSISPITIGTVSSLEVVSMLFKPTTDPNNPEFLGAIGAGSLAFTNAANPINLEASGIYASDDGTYAENAHRAGPLFTTCQVWVGNNAETTWEVRLKVEGSLVRIASPLSTESVMHCGVRAMNEAVTDDDDNLLYTITTNHAGNLRYTTSKASLNDDEYVVLYQEGTTTNGVHGDQFNVDVFLDFLPIDIPASTTAYDGTVEWLFTSSLTT